MKKFFVPIGILVAACVLPLISLLGEVPIKDARFQNHVYFSASATPGASPALVDWGVSKALGSGTDINWTITPSRMFSKTLSANTTFTFSNANDGDHIVVAITNTASNYTVTWPTVKWSGGSPPTETVGAKTDVITFVKFGSLIYGSPVQNFF